MNMNGKENRAAVNPANVVAALDLGCASFKLLAVEAPTAANFRVIGCGEAKARGMERGMVTNMEEVVAALKKTAEEAEIMSGVKLREVRLAVSGAHLVGRNSHGAVKIQGGEVSASEIQRVMETAQAVAIPAGQQILHALEQSFMIDDQPGIRQPLGMSGVRLEGDVHIITASANALVNLEQCVRRSGLAVAGRSAAAIAAGAAVLSDDERKLGVCIADIGAGVTDLAVFHGGAVRASASLPLAGGQIDNDIARMFHTSLASAEEIKVARGGVKFNPETMPESVALTDASGSGERELSAETLAQTIEARAEDIINQIRSHLEPFIRREQLAAGIVLTGGTSLLSGFAEMTERTLDVPVRIARPRYGGELAELISVPGFSVAAGLIMLALAERAEARDRSAQEGWRGRWRQFCRWLQDNF